MAWNTKSLQLPESKSAKVPMGSPVAVNVGLTGKAYKDGWDIERAYREGMRKVVWVFRCIDAISGNQARLDIVLRKGNSRHGQTVKRHDLYDVLNSKSNPGENSFIFRYRVSAQLLMSTRGVFIEKVRGRDGRVIALQILPPQMTAPIPDPRNFVSGFEVELPNGTKTILKPQDVIWLRRPHPLDPYLSMTPMESAGIAIEIENLARIYNRNFLMNDGRPGGLLVIRGEMDDDDKNELSSRFRGNLNRTGATTVIESEGGADFVDTAANPRDAAYIQMRQITKEEIQSAFGVPESIIANSQGRTFANASEEGKVFWMETMLPHLEIIARAFDELDDQLYVDFDTDGVPVLILAKQERERYLMDEMRTGLISPNEYREATGRKKIESELMDSMLANPNLTPIGNTEKPFDPAQQAPVDQGPPLQPGSAPDAPAMGEEAFAAPAPQPPADTPAEPAPAQEASARPGVYSVKELPFDDLDEKAEQAVDRWAEILDINLERLFERQQRVVLEKALGAKGRAALASKTLSVEQVFDRDVWNRQVNEDLRPIISGIVTEALRGEGVDPDPEEVKAYVDQQITQTEKVNDTTAKEIAAAITVLSLADDEDKSEILRVALVAVFAALLLRRKRRIAEQESTAAWNAGMYMAATRSGRQKMWRTRRDDSVRSQHRFLEGKAVPVGEPFKVEGFSLRFPGDPLAPAHLTNGCRCRLRIS